jgi:hypothetical protein
MTFSIRIFSIKIKNQTHHYGALASYVLHNSIMTLATECCYADCYICVIVVLSVVMMNAVMLSTIAWYVTMPTQSTSH